MFNVCFLFYQKRYKKTQSKFILLQVTCISLSHILWMNDCRLMYAKHDGKQPAEWYMHTAENEINCAYHYIIITPLKKPLEVISFCLICFNWQEWEKKPRHAVFNAKLNRRHISRTKWKIYHITSHQNQFTTVNFVCFTTCFGCGFSYTMCQLGIIYFFHFLHFCINL